MVEDDPNTKVTDEAYELLWKEFGHGEMPKREEKTAPVVEKPKEEEVKPLEPEPAKEEELTPVEEPERPHFKVLGKIDEASLSPSKKNKKEKAAPAEEEEQPTKSAPLQQEADIPQPEAQGDQVAAPSRRFPSRILSSRSRRRSLYLRQKSPKSLQSLSRKKRLTNLKTRLLKQSRRKLKRRSPKNRRYSP